MPMMIPPGEGITTTTPVGTVTTPSNLASIAAQPAGPPRQQQHPSPFRPGHGPDLVIMPHQEDAPAEPPPQQPQQQQQQQPAQMSRRAMLLHRVREVLRR